jgi:hypothetical protein
MQIKNNNNNNNNSNNKTGFGQARQTLHSVQSIQKLNAQ